MADHEAPSAMANGLSGRVEKPSDIFGDRVNPTLNADTPLSRSDLLSLEGVARFVFPGNATSTWGGAVTPALGLAAAPSSFRTRLSCAAALSRWGFAVPLHDSAEPKQNIGSRRSSNAGTQAGAIYRISERFPDRKILS